MNLEEADLFNDGRGVGLSSGVSSVSCSICLEVVLDNGERSRVKLQCGHEFHLDCIGSAFNVKGVMQCPNCRKIEKGQWLYANGCRSSPEFSMDELVPDEDLYDLSYPEMPVGIHWCPYSGLTTQIPSSFEEGETPSPTAYHDLLGHQAVFAELTAAPSAAHSCPYVAYFQTPQPSSLNSSESVADGHSFSHQWNGLSGPSDISPSHAFTAVDLHYHGWDHHPPPFSSGTDQSSVPSAALRPTRGDSEGVPISGSFVHPLLVGHGSGPRSGSSVISSMVPPYPSSNSRAHERGQALHAYPQQQQPNSLHMHSPLFSNARRSSGPMGMAPVGTVSQPSDHSSGFYVYPSSGSSSQNLQEAENPLRNHFYAWEHDQFAPYPLIPVDRDSSWWQPFHQTASGSDSSSRGGSYWHRHGSERMASQNRVEGSSFQTVQPSIVMHPFI